MFIQFEVVKLAKDVKVFTADGSKTYPKGTCATVLWPYSEDIEVQIHDEADTFLTKVGPELAVAADDLEAYAWPVEFTN